jgi:hypothetical protein
VPMNTTLLGAIICLCLALTGVFLAGMFGYMMIGEINRKREDGDLISYFGFTFPKLVRIFVEYQRLYPSGRLHIYALLAFLLSMLGITGVGVLVMGS